MSETRRKNLLLEGAQLMGGSYKNFSGRQSKYNRQGARNFCLIIPNDIAPQLQAEGWNIRIRPARDEMDAPIYYVAVNVSYGNSYFGDPKVVRMTSTTKIDLTEETIGQLDDDVILSADIVVRPHYYTDDNGETRVKGYLKELYAVVEDSLADKYAF